MRLPVFLLLMFLAGALGAAEAAPGCGPQTNVPDAERLANTLRWTTASEQDNFGYDVFRGTAEKGPFRKLTSKPILGNGTTDETSNYSYRDASIDPCKSYWYYVESISTQGERERFTPIFQAKAKRPALKSAEKDAGAAGSRDH